MATDLVIDADGHTMEPDDLWVERMDHERWGDWIPRKVTEDEVYESIYLGGVVRSGGRELRDAVAKAVGKTPKELYDLLESIRIPGGYDPHARLADMDRDGIDAAVLYPSLAMFFGYAGFEAEEWNIAACADFLGADRILWASDYPHPEFHPGVIKELHEAIGDLGDDDCRKVLGGNAIEAYRLPL